MKNIVKFETESMSVDRFFRSSESRAKFKASADRMQAVIDDPDKSDRAKLEARMVKAMVEFDHEEHARLIFLLEKLDAAGMSIVKKTLTARL